MGNYTDYGIEIPYRRTHGQVKCKCPQCKDKRTNKHDRSLSVNLDKGVWHCHYCNWSGSLETFKRVEYEPRKQYTKPNDTGQANYSPKMLSYLISRGISEAVAKKCKVGEGVELMPRGGEWKQCNTIQFKYYLEDELLNVKYRTADKVFKLCTGAELLPYNLDSIKDKDECIITEGEFDCLSFVEAGFTSCVSVPNGANSNLSYLDDFIEGWFEDKKVIYIASDNDAKGLELRDELIHRFGAERCKIVTYGDCKDANEHLVKYGKQSLRDCISRATDVPIEGVFTLTDYENDFDNLYLNGLKPGKTIGHELFDKAVSFETKRVCVVTGVPSSGKSEFLDEICVRLSLLYGWRTAFFSPENMPLTYHASKLVQKLTGKRFDHTHLSREEFDEAKDYLNDNFCHIMPEDGFTLDSILEKAKTQVRRKGIKILVIDPYNRLESHQGSKSETQYISEVLAKLTNFAQQQDVLVFLMAHPRKVQDEQGKPRVPSLYDINGSANFYNKADYGIVVHRYKGEELNQQYTLVSVDKVKFRHLGDGGKVYFKYNVQNGRYVQYDKDNNQENNFAWDDRNYLRCKINEPTYSPDEKILGAIRDFENGIGDDAPF